MSPEWGITKRFGSLSRSDLRALAVCILIAGLIWLLRSLTDEARDTFEIPVTYTLENQSVDFIQLNQEFIEVEVTSSGFGILGQRYFRRDEPLLVDLNKSGISKGRIAIGTVSLRPQLIRSIGNDREIISIRPDSIIALVSPVSSKSVPIHPIYTIANPEDQKLLSPPTLTPDQIEVMGPELILDTLRQIHSTPFLCDGSGKATIRLSLPSELSVKRDTVNATWDLDELRLTSIKANIELTGDTSGLDVRFFPAFSKISFTTNQQIDQLLQSQPIRVTVDASRLMTLAAQGKQKVDLTIENVPAAITDLSLSPGRVEFLLLQQ